MGPRLFSALFNAVLLPIKVVQDVVDISNAIDGNDSYTRQQIEKIEDDLGL